MSSAVPYLDLLDKPFAYGGRGPECYDCYGLAMEICRRGGITLPEYASVSEAALIDERLEGGKRYFEEMPQPEPLCLVLFMVRPPFVSHVGVMLDGSRFVHIMTQSRVSVERVDSLSWSRRVRGFYRLRT